MPPLGGCWGVNVWNGVAAGTAGGPGGGGGPPLPLNFCTHTLHELVWVWSARYDQKERGERSIIVLELVREMCCVCATVYQINPKRGRYLMVAQCM